MKTSLIRLLFLLPLLAATACSEEQSATPINDNPTDYGYTVVRNTVLDESFSAAGGSFAASGGTISIQNGVLRIGQNAVGYDTVSANVSLAANIDYEMEMTVTQVSGNSFGIQWGRNVLVAGQPDFRGERLVIQRNTSRVQYFADRDGAAPAVPTLEQGFTPVAIGSPIRITFRMLGSTVFLFVNQVFVGQVGSISDNETQTVSLNTQEVDAAEIAVDNIRIARLLR